MHRRDLLRFGAAAVAAGLQPSLLSAAPLGKPEAAAVPAAGSAAAPATVNNIEQWGIFEVSLTGPSAGNPYKDVTLTARFTMGHRSVQVTGFYDGEGTYRVRFMPDALGHWSYEPVIRASSSARRRLLPATMGRWGPRTSFTSSTRMGRHVSLSAPRLTRIYLPATRTPGHR